MINVAVNGYGTIGKRVADAIVQQPDMKLIGVSKTRPNHEAITAVEKKYPLYVVKESKKSFLKAGIKIEGTVKEMLDGADIVVDATPSGVGIKNYELYKKLGIPTIVQGGESKDAVESSFNARANFESSIGKNLVRVVSCNSTGLARLLTPIEEVYGIEQVRATLVRRGADPGQPGGGPINDVILDPVHLPSHHGPDVKSVLPGINIDTLALKVPTTLMHIHVVNITLKGDAEKAGMCELLSGESRIHMVAAGEGIKGIAGLKELALDLGRPRGDLWENCVWEESVSVDSKEMYLFQAIHQEADVVPENIDAIRAMVKECGREESMELTDRTMGMGLGR